MIDLDELEREAKQYSGLGAHDALRLLALARAGRRLAEAAGPVLSGVPHGEWLMDHEQQECDALSAALAAWQEADGG